MRAVIQRVSKASVSVDGRQIASIGKGMLILLGVEDPDTESDINWLCNKILQMRIFEDEQGKMNLSIEEVQGEIIVVSQFTLHASTKKGNRPSFIKAAKPALANALYLDFIKTLRSAGKANIQSGEFGAMMDVSLTNDGPVTIFMDTKMKE